MPDTFDNLDARKLICTEKLSFLSTNKPKNFTWLLYDKYEPHKLI